MTLLGRKTKRKETSSAVVQPPVQPPVFQAVSHPAASQTTLNLTSSPQFSSILPPAYSAADFKWTGPPETFYRQPETVSASQPCLPQRRLLPNRPNPKTQGQNTKNNASKASLLTAANLPNLGQDVASKSSTSLAAVPGPSRAAGARHGLQDSTAHYMNRGAALCDRISSRFNEIITSMDGQGFRGDEREMYIQYSAAPGAQFASRSLSEPAVPNLKYSSNYFAKVWQYANSRLPPHLPPLKVYMPTYPLLCLAAQYSEKVYARPTRAEQETHIAADWRRGTKAMVLKSVAVDDLNTIVFAIRGSQTFMDWAVNFRPAPASPKGFLDDPGNLCHSGFLSVARHMIGPVSKRLRTLIEENPSRRTYSLLICGHSAGGAVAALLFCHMLSSVPTKGLVEPDLVELAPFFRRIHCVTFGAPPVSLLPLQKPGSERWKKCLFFSFINEGDPVVRADKQVVGSLLRLYATPAPSEVMYEAASAVSLQTLAQKRKPLVNVQASGGTGKGKAVVQQMPTWDVPPSTLSNAGRLVLLRTEVKANGEEKVQACVTNDEQLRGAVFGDPICHSMTLYAKRMESLATQAVTMRID
ncbi:MAG: hypothetical protein Q9165_000477 [Trypethelium subeluteriae]